MRRAPKGGIWLIGRFYKGGQFLPKPARSHVPVKAMDDEALVLIAMSELPTSVEAARSMHRYMSGRATQRDKTILDGRRIQAIQSLRDMASCDREWKKWASMYAEAARGMA